MTKGNDQVLANKDLNAHRGTVQGAPFIAEADIMQYHCKLKKDQLVCFNKSAN